MIENVKGLKDIFGNEYETIAKEQISLIREISGHIEGITAKVEEMTEERKKAIISSRIDTIGLITKKLKEKNILPKALISASGSSYYPEGNQHNTEESPAGNGFLAQVTIQWEKAANAVKALGVRTVILRTGVVLSNGGGAIPQMAFPAKFGFGAPLGSGKQYIAWIHIDDICGMYLAAMENETWNGVYNAIAAPPVTNEELTKQICIALDKPQWLPNVPAFALKLAFGEMASVVLESNYVVNKRIKEDTDFRYRFPDLGLALKAVFSGK